MALSSAIPVLKRSDTSRTALKIGILFGVLIFLLAATTRLGWPGIVEFKGDEAALSTLALDMAHGQGIPLLGINSSVGIPNPPMSVYLMAIPYSVSTDPIVATMFVALLNVIAVLLLYMLVWRYYGLSSAVIAGLLYAADPWAILYSRKIWEQNLLPIFVIAIIGTGLIGLVEGKRWAQWLHLPLLSIAGQLHYGSFVLIPVTIWFIVVGIHRKQLHPALFGGLIIAILLTLPYLIGMGQVGLLDLEQLKHAMAVANVGHTATPLVLSGDGFHNALLVIGGAEIYSLAGSAYQDYLNSVAIASLPTSELINLVVIAASAWLIARTIRRRLITDQRRQIDIAILLWLIVTPLVYSISWTPVFTHYYIAMIPAAFMVLGVAIADLQLTMAAQRLNQAVKIVGGCIVAGIALVEAAAFIVLLGFIDTHAASDGFGVPLHDLMPARQMVLNSGATSILAKFDGQFMLADPEATVWNALLYPIPSVRFVDAQTDVYPASESVIFTRTCQGSTADARLLAGNSTCFSLTPRQKSDFDPSSFTPITPTRANPSIHFDNGAYLIGYQWRRTSTNACLNLAWGVETNFKPDPRASDTQDYHFAVHFTNAMNQETVIADALSWRTAFWRPGDVIVRTFCVSDVAKISAITGVRLGMYTYAGTSFHNSNLIDPNRTPVAPVVVIRFNPFF